MFYYLSSSIPSALKINGVFFGIINEDAKKINIDTPCAYIELSPVSVSAESVNFLLDDSFFCSPPPLIYLTDLKGGYLIKFCPVKENKNFFIINQQKFDFALVTVFNENGLKLSIETQSDFYAESFSVDIEGADIGAFTLKNGQFIYVCLELSNDKKQLLVYLLDSKIAKVFCREIEEFCVENTFSTTERFFDIKKHKITSFWEFNGQYFVRNDCKIEKNKSFNLENLPTRVIPFAFLEDLLVGDSIEEYLSTSLLENKNFLQQFFGDFLGVIPPPEFIENDKIGLIYRKNDNIYFVEYFIFELNNNKICGIKKVE